MTGVNIVIGVDPIFRGWLLQLGGILQELGMSRIFHYEDI